MYDFYNPENEVEHESDTNRWNREDQFGDYSRLGEQGNEVYLLNRGKRTDSLPDGIQLIQVDIHDEAEVARLIQDMQFDVVADFTATIRFDQGIKETIAYGLSHPEFQMEDPEFDRWCDQVIDAMEVATTAFTRK